MLRGRRHGWFIPDNPCLLRTGYGVCDCWFSLILGGPHLFLLCNSSKCSALTTVPTIIQASKKRKKTAKAPVEQSNVEKEKADIRKRLHLSKDDMDDRLNPMKKVYYRWMAHEDCVMPQFVTFKKEIFWDVDEFTLQINPTDIIKLLTGEKLGTNILALFSRESSWILLSGKKGKARKTIISLNKWNAMEVISVSRRGNLVAVMFIISKWTEK
nr:ulp1 protease family, C-terminal catalytic domain-containing protein [Tanacetum cinerariifolium]